MIDLEIRGKVAKKYGDDINTDYIIPAYLLQESWDKQFFADHAFEYYDPSFKSACRANKESIVVAANNFGCGSSREQAVYAVKYNNVDRRRRAVLPRHLLQELPQQRAAADPGQRHEHRSSQGTSSLSTSTLGTSRT